MDKGLKLYYQIPTGLQYILITINKEIIEQIKMLEDTEFNREEIIRLEKTIEHEKNVVKQRMNDNKISCHDVLKTIVYTENEVEREIFSEYFTGWVIEEEGHIGFIDVKLLAEALSKLKKEDLMEIANLNRETIIVSSARAELLNKYEEERRI